MSLINELIKGLLPEEEKKQIHRRYSDAVLNLSQAFALAASSDDAKKIRDEVGFFQAIRAALAKSDGKKKKTKEDYMTLFVEEEIKRTGQPPSLERMKELEPMAALLAGETVAGEAAKDADGNEIIL